MSNKPTNIKYMHQEELNKLKNKLLEKLYRDIDNKYKNILNDKGYNIQFFKKEFSKKVENYFDFNNPDYKKFFKQIEKDFLNKMNKIDDIKREAMPDQEEIEYLSNPKRNEAPVTNGFDNPYNSVFNNNEKTKREKLRNLIKHKMEKDEWGIIAKKDHAKYLREQKEKENVYVQKRKEYFETLNQQMKEKSKHKHELEEQDKRIDEEIKKNNEMMDKEELKKIRLEKEKLAKQKEELFKNINSNLF
jgi:hypothetical protein